MMMHIVCIASMVFSVLVILLAGFAAWLAWSNNMDPFETTALDDANDWRGRP